MSKQQAKYKFIIWQSLYMIYQEKADSYRLSVGRDVQVYSDLLAKVALRKADYYEAMC